MPHFWRFNRRKRTADLSCLAKTSLGCYHHCCQRCRRLTIIDVRLPSLLPSLNHLVDHWDFQMDQPGATFSGFARYPQHPWRIWQLKGLVAQGRLGRSECFPWKVTCNLQAWLWGAMIFISKMEILGPCSGFYWHYPLSLSPSPSLSLSLASSGNSSNPAALRIRSIPRLGVSQKWPSVKSLSFALCEVHAMAAMVKTWRCIPSPWVIIHWASKIASPDSHEMGWPLVEEVKWLVATAWWGAADWLHGDCPVRKLWKSSRVLGVFDP